MDSVLFLVEKGPTSRNSFVMGFVMILEKNKYERNKQWSPWAIAGNFLRGALNFCFLLMSCTACRTDSIWEDYRSAHMYNTVCWPKQSVSVPFAFYIKKKLLKLSHMWNHSLTLRLFLLPSRLLCSLIRGGTCPLGPYRLIAYGLRHRVKGSNRF